MIYVVRGKSAAESVKQFGRRRTTNLMCLAPDFWRRVLGSAPICHRLTDATDDPAIQRSSTTVYNLL